LTALARYDDVGETMTTKEQAVQIISRLPDDATVSDIMAELYVQLKIERGLKQLDAGESLDQAEVEKRLRKWLK
jgi:predicted transcriptional regulator